MIIKRIELNFFRNYVDEVINFADGGNLISGKNAQGKTNLLEAIYLLCITRSFRTRHEKEIINFNNSFFTIKGEFQLDNGSEKKVVFYYTLKEGKQVSVNRVRINKLSDHIGKFPVVMSSPEEYNLTTGPPVERRRFIDILLSQLSTKYITELQNYNRIVKQRNKILSNRQYSKSQLRKILEPWNESLIEKGSYLVFERIIFIKKLDELVKAIYPELNLGDENVRLQYRSNLLGEDIRDIKERFYQKLDELWETEFEQGVTVLGPHRDNIAFLINDKELRKFGSRGQHKTLLIALAIAEYHLIKDKTNETPIILIDDLFSEIDDVREEKFVSYLQGLGQVIITTTMEISKYAIAKHFHIENGHVE